MSRRVRVRLAMATAGAAVLVLGWVAAWATREPSGPASSSYATSPEGVAAYADLLARLGHRVDRLRTDLAASDLDPGSTVVVIDPVALPVQDAAALRRFLDAGGRLVVAGSPPGEWLARVVDEPPRWAAGAPELARPVADVPEVAGIRTVRTGGRGAFSRTGSGAPVLGGPSGAIAVVARVGAGRAVIVSDAGLFQNRLLARADNAAFAVAVAGGAGRRVAFVESVHGYGEAIGLAALPRRWWWALGGFGVAMLALMWARGARLGPAEVPSREFSPPRRAYVEALAASLARTRAPAGIAQPLQREARRLAVDGVEIPDDDRRLLEEPPHTAGEALRVGRVFARLVKQRGGTS